MTESPVKAPAVSRAGEQHRDGDDGGGDDFNGDAHTHTLLRCYQVYWRTDERRATKSAEEELDGAIIIIGIKRISELYGSGAAMVRLGRRTVFE